MICPFCGCFFCDDQAEVYILGAPIRIYCSTDCKERDYNRRRFRERSKRKLQKKLEAARRENPDLPINVFINHIRKKPHYLNPIDAVIAYILLEEDTEEIYPNGGIYYCCELGWQITRNVSENKEEKDADEMRS